MPEAPRFIDLPETTIVGIRVTAPFEQLFTAVPEAWRLVFALADELGERLDEGFVDCSLGEVSGVYTELIGGRFPLGASAPDGFEAIKLPAARYATVQHLGDVRSIARSFGDLERWVTEQQPTASGERWVHDGVKLDIGYLPAMAETSPYGGRHTLYIRLERR